MADHERFGEVLHDCHAEPPSASPSAGDRAIARIAGRQRGLVTRAQLAEAGLGRGAIAHRVSRGRLHRVHRGVYLVGHRVPAPLATETAALLACGPAAVLSHRSAAAVWQMPVRALRDVEVSLIAREPSPRPGIRVHRVPSLDPRDRRRRSGLTLTAPARTLLDLGALLAPRALEQALAEALAHRLLSQRDLQAALARAPRRRGAAALRALLQREQGPALTRSAAEELLLAIVRAERLPEPESNVRVGAYVVDFLWRGRRLVVEVDGYAFHSSRTAFERDHRRDADLGDAGWRVRRVTWRQLTEDRDAVARRLRRALASGPDPPSEQRPISS
jgi:very-short-patch-repair endonuclease